MIRVGLISLLLVSVTTPASSVELVVSGGFDGTVRVWETSSFRCLRTLRSERRYERLDITGVAGINAAQRALLLALGAVEQPAIAN